MAELATKQHGVVSARQLRDLGVSDSAIGREVDAGRLHPLHRGVYAVGHRVLPDRGRCLAAVLASGSSAVLSHRSAGWLWGLTTSLPSPVDVTAPTGRHRHARIRLHRARNLRPEDLDTRDGISVTAVPRTMLDLAVALSPPRIDRLFERADQLELLDLSGIADLLERTRGHRGRRKLRTAAQSYRSEPRFTRSALERRFLELVERSGLPMPLVNLNVVGHEVDMFWPEHRFAVELDGFEHHRTRAAFERDRVRQEDLKLAGIDSIRITARRVREEPDTVMSRLRDLLHNQPHRDPYWT